MGAAIPEAGAAADSTPVAMDGAIAGAIVGAIAGLAGWLPAAACCKISIAAADICGASASGAGVAFLRPIPNTIDQDTFLSVVVIWK